MTRFKFNGEWHFIIKEKTKHDDELPYRFFVYDFSGVLEFTGTYKYEYEIEKLLSSRFGKPLQCKEMNIRE